MKKWFVLFLTVLFWGLAFTAIKYSVQIISPVAIASLRFGIATILFAVLILSGRRISRIDIPKVFVLGIFGVSIYHVFLNAGEIYVSSGVASVIISLAPIFVLALSSIVLKEKITAAKVVGTLIAFSGVVVISEPSYTNILGISLVMVSTIAAAIYTTFGKSLLSRYDPITLTSYAMVLGSIPLYVFLPESVGALANHNDPLLIGSVVFLGVFSTFFGYLGWYYILEKEEASRASVLLLAIPVVSILAGYLLLGEELTLRTLIGSIAVILGIYIVLRKK
jgi:drug/metabolite transporter (DMT)-like permease